ncbi:hypothetical protein MXD98_16700, partial [Legionella pneumophila]|nr:hypothetical protein [Legionella pneumophila]
STEAVHHILREQVTQALARITTNQINYLSQENQEAYLIMLDFPLKTLMINSPIGLQNFYVLNCSVKKFSAFVDKNCLIQ